MGKVISIHDGSGVTDKDQHPDVILENLKGTLEGFVYAAYDKDGNEVFGSSYADGGTALWLIERLKKVLLSDPDE